MLPSRETMLERMYASDTTCNGKFITGVLSTGIYCLPSCSARKPLAENVQFFPDEESAQAAGLRACRRCRPDNFYRQYDPDFEAVTSLISDLRNRTQNYPDISAMADRSELGLTKLNGLIRKHYHSTPLAILTHARIAKASALLSDAGAQSADVGFEVGYDSLSAFHENFRRRTGMRPLEYQSLGSRQDFVITLPDNYRSEFMLARHERDPLSPNELVTERSLSKAILFNDSAVVLTIEFEGATAKCRLDSDALLPQEAYLGAHAIVIRLLGMVQDPEPFERRSIELGFERLTTGRKGLRIPLTADPFEAIVWSIVGQQVNLAFAYKLRRELFDAADTKSHEGLAAHPSPAAVAALDYGDLTSRQYSRRKAEYLIDTARLVVEGVLPDRYFATASATETEKALISTRGFGPWSTNYVMMFGYGFADCLPIGDTALRSSLARFHKTPHQPTVAEIESLMLPFSPYRSLATYHLWMSLGDPEL